MQNKKVTYNILKNKVVLEPTLGIIPFSLASFTFYNKAIGL